MPEKDVCFELWRASDLDDRGVGEILELLRASFQRWPPFDPGVALADHLRWKMESPTAELAAVVGRASNGASAGTLVASLTIVTQRIRAFGRELPRLRFIDQEVDEDWRLRLLQCVDVGLDRGRFAPHAVAFGGVRDESGSAEAEEVAQHE
jgi:hypothetical protein